MQPEEALEKLIAGLAKYGRHAKIVLYPNRSGQVLDGFGKNIFYFSTLEELFNKLCNGSLMKNQNVG